MRSLLKSVLEVYVGYLASIFRFSFPPKYNWRWKLEVLLGRYESETTRVIASELRPGMTFIDIGAHIGYFSRLAANKVGSGGRVIAFEADHENVALLERNTAHLPQVTCVKKAISDSEGTATFYHVRNSTGCHSLVPNENSESYEVAVTSLDEYLAEHHISPHMIKMDIEGGEWKALIGMKKTLQTPGLILILEYNPEALGHAGINPHDLLQHLEHSGYRLSLLTENGKHPLSPTSLSDIDTTIGKAGSINLYCAKM